jgi:DNA-binding transcriptional ArsR family regulator
MNLKQLQTKAGAAEALLKAAANRNRLVILCELLGGEKSVSALQAAVGLSQSALSQHLARLREDDLVATRRESQAIYYSLASDHVTRLIGLLYELYCTPAGAAKTVQRPRKTL